MSGEIFALDSGVLIGWGNSDRVAEAAIQSAQKRGAYIIIPAPVLAESLRGTPRTDARINQLIKAVNAVVSTSGSAAREAGTRLASVTTTPPPTVDALIVATAEESGARAIITYDPGDIGSLIRSARVIPI